MIDPVQAQYEAYPYPARDPAEEAQRLLIGSPSQLLEVNHFLFRGALDFDQPFRALVAGGGTGDATIMLAQQLADAGRGGEVVYLDLSTAAREIAEARAKARGLTNISFHKGSLLDLPRLRLGRFDYIDCCGVLHHLPDPPAGLDALKAVLTDNGGMGLMLYGSLGRRGVYDMQAMLRRLCGGRPLAEQVATARRLLGALPDCNWFKRNPFIDDHKLGDNELVDLLLHSQDRAYRVAEIGELVEQAGLKLVTFMEPVRYDPATYLDDPGLLAGLKGLTPLERAAFAEELCGNMKVHVFYVSAAAQATVAEIEGPQTVPCLKNLEGPKLAAAVARSGKLKFSFPGIPLSFPVAAPAPAILQNIDGRRSLGEIHAILQMQNPGLDWKAFLGAFQALYGLLGGLGQLLLRNPAA